MVAVDLAYPHLSFSLRHLNTTVVFISRELQALQHQSIVGGGFFFYFGGDTTHEWNCTIEKALQGGPCLHVEPKLRLQQSLAQRNVCC
jgi:hypothetical protein